jgi:uncharacterized protein YjaG (DUF416 family)
LLIIKVGDKMAEEDNFLNEIVRTQGDINIDIFEILVHINKEIELIKKRLFSLEKNEIHLIGRLSDFL